MTYNRRSSLRNRIEADQLPHGSGLADIVAEHAGGAAVGRSSVARMRIVVALPASLRILRTLASAIVTPQRAAGA
jgi:hypothetical protein